MPGHYEAIYVHGQDMDFGPSEKKRKDAPKTLHPFCRKHRTHFCPCVRPGMYKGNLPQARKEWDEWLKEDTLKRRRPLAGP